MLSIQLPPTTIGLRQATAGSLVHLHSSAWRQGCDTHSRAKHSADTE